MVDTYSVAGAQVGSGGPRDGAGEPDFATWLFYLDCGDDFGRLEKLLHRWYDEATRRLLPFVHPNGADAPASSLSAFDQDVSGRSRRRRPRHWTDGLTEDLYQLSVHWFDAPPTTVASELDLYIFRFADRRHVKLQISIGFEGRPGRLPLVLPELLELARVLGDEADPAYGEIVVNGGTLAPATMLDAALDRPAAASAAQSRERLRGYEWVTVCPKELLARLGGVAALRHGGAFAEVLPLTHGGVLLRATDVPGEYRGDRVRAAFRALAPVLPAGLPGTGSVLPPTGAGSSSVLSGVPVVLSGGEPGHDLSRVVLADPTDPGGRLDLGPAALGPIRRG